MNHPKKTYYEMWYDNTDDFKESIRRMIRLGYRFDIKFVKKEYQQSQILGSNEKIN